MRRWIEAGVTPAQLFRAATIENARFFGLDRDVGTVGRGKRADLMLMTRNPMTDGSAYDAIDYVVVGGKLAARRDLAADQRPSDDRED
jgi:imidazolonepropionase-like amidohydrolase